MKLEFDGNTLYKTGDTISLELKDGSSLVFTDNGMYTAEEIAQASLFNLQGIRPLRGEASERERELNEGVANLAQANENLRLEVERLLDHRVKNQLANVLDRFVFSRQAESEEQLAGWIEAGIRANPDGTQMFPVKHPDEIDLTELSEAQLRVLQIDNPHDLKVFEELSRREAMYAEGDRLAAGVFKDSSPDDRLVILKPLDLADLEFGREFRQARQWWTSRNLDQFPVKPSEIFAQLADLNFEKTRLEDALTVYREAAEADLAKNERQAKTILELQGALGSLNNDAELGRAYRTAQADALRDSKGYVPRDPELVFQRLNDLRLKNADLASRVDSLTDELQATMRPADFVKVEGKGPVGDDEAPAPDRALTLPPEGFADHTEDEVLEMRRLGLTNALAQIDAEPESVDPVEDEHRPDRRARVLNALRMVEGKIEERKAKVEPAPEAESVEEGIAVVLARMESARRQGEEAESKRRIIEQKSAKFDEMEKTRILSEETDTPLEVQRIIEAAREQAGSDASREGRMLSLSQMAATVSPVPDPAKRFDLALSKVEERDGYTVEKYAPLLANLNVSRETPVEMATVEEVKVRFTPTHFKNDEGKWQAISETLPPVDNDEPETL